MPETEKISSQKNYVWAWSSTAQQDGGIADPQYSQQCAVLRRERSRHPGPDKLLKEKNAFAAIYGFFKPNI